MVSKYSFGPCPRCSATFIERCTLSISRHQLNLFDLHRDYHQIIQRPEILQSRRPIIHRIHRTVPTATLASLFLDDRVIGINATDATRDEWARERWQSVQLLWAFMILLHFAALLHIDPLVIHFLNVVFRLVPEENDPMISPYQAIRQV